MSFHLFSVLTKQDDQWHQDLNTPVGKVTHTAQQRDLEIESAPRSNPRNVTTRTIGELSMGCNVLWYF